MAKKHNDEATRDAIIKYARSLYELEQAMLRRARFGCMGTDIEHENRKVENLFHYLLAEYPEYHAAAERPHDPAGFRKVLKRIAAELHKEHRVVVTLDRARVYIESLDDPRLKH